MRLWKGVDDQVWEVKVNGFVMRIEIILSFVIVFVVVIVIFVVAIVTLKVMRVTNSY